MSVNPDIHDKAYQFFIEEAAELLQIIEDGILELRRDRGANTVHAVMRAAHSIKGGAASVELEAIKSISHRMETAFRALYDETVEIDDELEGLLLDGFDSLKDPLSEQIETGTHDPEAALANAIPVLEALEANLGADALKQADNYIPSSSDLGIDMVTSIFEIDVDQGIARLEEVAANPENFPVLGEIHAQAEVFVGFGELLELPGFGEIAQAMLNASANGAVDEVELLNIALKDLQAARDLVMGGDRDQGGAPSAELLALAGGNSSPTIESSSAADLSSADFADFGLSEADLANFDFGSADLGADLDANLSPALANSDISPLKTDSPDETGILENFTEDAGLTDAGLGDFDLAALQMEGDALINNAAAPTVAQTTEQPLEGLAMEDFQSLISESNNFDEEDGEFATVEQSDETAIGLNLDGLEDPAVEELEASRADTSAFDSLDAMAQLANLMAEPNNENAEGETNDSAFQTLESGLAETNLLEEPSSETDTDPLELNTSEIDGLKADIFETDSSDAEKLGVNAFTTEGLEIDPLEMNDLGTANLEINDFEADSPEANDFENGFEIDGSEADSLEVANLEANDFEIGGSEAVNLEANAFEIDSSGANGLEAANFEVNIFEAGNLEVSDSEISNSEISNSEISDSEINGSEADGSEADKLEVNAFETDSRETDSLEVNNLEAESIAGNNIAEDSIAGDSLKADSAELTDVFNLEPDSEAEPLVLEDSELINSDLNAELDSDSELDLEYTDDSAEIPPLEENTFNFAPETEPAGSQTEALTGEAVEGDAEPTAASIAVPDAELENMWAELDESTEDAFESSTSPELNNAFEIALDAGDAAVVADSLNGAEATTPQALEQDASSGADLEDIFGSDVMSPEASGDEASGDEASGDMTAPEEADVITPLSIAEADAAFEALVDASTEDSCESEPGPDEDNLDLSFDDALEPVSEAEEDSLDRSFGDVLEPVNEAMNLEQPDLEGPAPEGLDLEQLDPKQPAEQAPDESENHHENLDSLIGTDSLVETTKITETPVDLEEMSTPDLGEGEDIKDPWSSLTIETTAQTSASETSSLSEAEAPNPKSLDEAPAPEEQLDEETFIQSMDMGTFIQTSDGFSAAIPEIVSPSIAEPEGETEESATPAMGADESASLSDRVSNTAVTEAQQPESIPDGTFIQGFETGTFIQGVDDSSLMQDLAAEEESLTNSVETTASLSEENESVSSSPVEQATVKVIPLERAAPSLAESFDEGTFIQNVGDTGKYAIEEAVATDEDNKPEGVSAEAVESFDEGTFIQGPGEGTFIQGITDVATESDNDAWNNDSDLGNSAETEGALIPELQAFIAQAAAESASTESKQSGDRLSSNRGHSSSTSPDHHSAPEEVLEPLEQSDADSFPDAATDDGTENIVELLSGQPHLESAEESAEETVEDNAVSGRANEQTDVALNEAATKTDQSDEEEYLPSLETMFSMAPEQLAAIADDSLTAELMESADLDAFQSIQTEANAQANPEGNAAEGNAAESHAAENSTAEAETGPASQSDEAIGSSEVEASEPAVTPLPSSTQSSTSTPQTSAAVEVALAEHQAEANQANTTDDASRIQGTQLTPAKPTPESSINAAVLAVEQMFGQLPTNNQLPPVPAKVTANASGKNSTAADTAKTKQKKRQKKDVKLSGISVRVDLSVLERMNNLVGELVLSRNSLSLQHEQLQSVVTQLDKRFRNFDGQLNGLRGISDQMLVEPAQRQASQPASPSIADNATSEADSLLEGFDVLEMDRYSSLHGQLQEIFEQLMQLEEGVDDIGVLLEQSTQSLTQQRQRLGLLQNELMWARMLPLDNILGRFPRVLRDMARKHGKAVDLNMNGTSVLVDKGMLEKLHDPMLHLLRNAFDHGIEKPDERKAQGKPDRGEIQINAYYQGNQTVIEIKDDGQGVSLERIAKRAVELEWLTREEVKGMPQQTLLDLIFEPGFTTAAKLSELSGRGVGLDVVREQIKGLKGSVTVDFEKGKGTTFTLRLPLTLTVAKLMVCQVGSTAIALPSDGIEDLLVPQPEQLKMVGNKRLLHWRDDLIPIQSMTELLDYSCPTADIANLKAITAKSIPVPQDWALPLLIFSRGSQRCAMEVNRLLMEQELVIKPFSSAMTPPEYSYGCTILGDGRMIPVLDGTALLQQLSDHSMAMAAGVELTDDILGEEAINDGTDASATMAQAMQADTILVVDDSTAMRRTMALSLEKAGYRVLQAGDGQEALTQLRQSSNVQLVICDVEMPNMNGFEFLSQRRREPMLMKVPVVMLTSRSSDKHRRLAMQLNAHDYFSKPYVEQEFLKSIQTILSKQSAAKA